MTLNCCPELTNMVLGEPNCIIECKTVFSSFVLTKFFTEPVCFTYQHKSINRHLYKFHVLNLSPHGRSFRRNSQINPGIIDGIFVFLTDGETTETGFKTQRNFTGLFLVVHTWMTWCRVMLRLDVPVESF